MARSLPRRDFLKAVRILKPRQSLSPEALARSLVGMGYESHTTVIAPGMFARRGGIFDLWPPAEPGPVRLDFFGDEIDSLRRFDPASQRSLQPLTEALISPAREFLIKLDVTTATGANDVLQIETRDEAGGSLTYSEFHIPLLHPSPANLLDYLPRQTLVLVDNWEDLQNAALEVEEQSVGLRADLVEEGQLREDFPIPYLTWTEIEDALSDQPLVELGPSSAPQNSYLAQRFSSETRFGGRLKPLLDHLADRTATGDELVVVSRQAARLNELWSELAANQAPTFIEGSLTEGWIFTPPSGPVLHLLTDGEIFGWRRPEPRQRPRASA